MDVVYYDDVILQDVTPCFDPFVKREAYLVSDQTHRRDERREGSADRRISRQTRHAPRNVGLQDLTQIFAKRCPVNLT